MITNLGFGGASLSSLRSYKEANFLLNTAFELGIRHYDTAPLYGQGYSELIIGKSLKNKRNEISITTKFGLGHSKSISIPAQIALPLNYYKKKIQNNRDKALTNITISSQILTFRKIEAAQIEKSISESLKRLQTDCIDYYLLHEGIPSFLDEKALNVLLSLKKRGMVKKIGIATDYFNVAALHPENLIDWDILQYDLSTDASGPSDLKKRYPEKIHFLHSVLKNLKNSQKGYDSKLAAELLAQAVKVNPKGKVLFSTRSAERLLNNIEEFLKII